MSQLLMYSTIKQYYAILSKNKSEMKKQLKIDILFFQIWMICIEADLIDPDAAMLNKKLF